MVIDVDSNDKYIDIWLFKGEQAPSVDDYSRRHPDYDITIWHSGTQNVIDLTCKLLQNNF